MESRLGYMKQKYAPELTVGVIVFLFLILKDLLKKF